MNMVSEDVNQLVRQVLEYAKKLVLLVLELAGGRIITDTRMQKLAFLVNQEVFKWVKFEANDYGPYSKELMKAVYKLEKEKKLIYVWDNDGLSKYYLTEKGKLEAKNLLEQLKAEDKDKLNRAMEIIQKHKDVPIPYLIAYVYKYYPEYAEKSKIKDKVEEWIRQYHL
jgi:uncharacterized protein YwgA